ncbi:MAG: hypothetical protein LBQ59_03145 [Candidatus Peribacteria bacterium]|nr:hypothetical protein [Candidatus Peribacteria bacterium]
MFNLQEKFDKITISEIKDKNIINMLNYLNAKVNFTLLKLQNSDLTNIQPTKITTTEK